MVNKKSLKKKVIITGGGSGGHVSAASSIISAIRNEYLINNSNFLYIGGDLGMEDEKPGNSIEKRVFAKEEFNKKYIRAGKLQRSMSLKTIQLLFRVILGFIDSYKIIREFKPNIVISTGGFVTVPVCVIAKIFKADIYLHEQTAAIGLSNKIVSKFATKIFITFPSSSKYFPKEKTIHTGNLVRQEIFQKTANGAVSQSLKRMLVNQEELPIIYISGGGLGSHCINTTVKEALQTLLQDFQVILQTGDNKKYNDFQTLQKEKNKLEKDLKDRFYVTKYIDRKEIGFLLNNIDLFVGRAGANTVYEAGILKIPSIFIPIPWVTHNEQERNAQILKELGLAEIINEGELTPEFLLLKIERFISKEKTVDTGRLQSIFLKDADRKILRNIGL
jgi:UDP-N-acetylglucosamine--N-acetylmuramyl-(pentapeptide) pyrophosphoryl-undecaprenol N-acetylglucosamine transferase